MSNSERFRREAETRNRYEARKDKAALKTCYRCGMPIRDPEMLKEGKQYRHLNACPQPKS